MFLADLANSGSLPVLSATLSLAGQRQRLLAHNIANIDTPDFRPVDIDVNTFRAQLARAVVERRNATGGTHGALDLAPAHGPGVAGAPAHPDARPLGGRVLYHDRNNRDVERMMQDLAENSLTFRLTTDLIRRENDLLRSAIAQRV
ncbi:MAG: hypothetical protein SFY69_00695 [Planctomycetota bacterium]|nr:hypothetical protein [Planctomycetota bacterium]